MSKAAPSSRAYEHCMFSFGLINIPLSVFTGTVSDHGIRRKEFVSVPVLDDNGVQIIDQVTQDDGTVVDVPRFEDHPVGRMAKDMVTEAPLEPGAEVVRKIPTDYGFVEVSDAEVEKLFELTPKTITVKSFQPRHLWDTGQYPPQGLYFVEASKLKVGTRKMENKAATQALALVLEAMAQENAIAVVEFTTHGKPKPAVLLPDGTLWTVHYTDALREQRPKPEVTLAEAVVNQGRMLIKTSWSETPLDLSDERSALIQAFANEKAAAGDFGKPTEVSAEPDTQADAGTDLMAMLQLSLDQQAAAQAG